MRMVSVAVTSNPQSKLNSSVDWWTVANGNGKCSQLVNLSMQPSQLCHTRRSLSTNSRQRFFSCCVWRSFVIVEYPSPAITGEFVLGDMAPVINTLPKWPRNWGQAAFDQQRCSPGEARVMIPLAHSAAGTKANEIEIQRFASNRWGGVEHLVRRCGGWQTAISANQ